MPHSEAQAWWADVQHVRESIERRRAGGAESSAPLDAPDAPAPLDVSRDRRFTRDAADSLPLMDDLDWTSSLPARARRRFDHTDPGDGRSRRRSSPDRHDVRRAPGLRCRARGARGSARAPVAACGGRRQRGGDGHRAARPASGSAHGADHRSHRLRPVAPAPRRGRAPPAGPTPRRAGRAAPGPRRALGRPSGLLPDPRRGHELARRDAPGAHERRRRRAARLPALTPDPAEAAPRLGGAAAAASSAEICAVAGHVAVSPRALIAAIRRRTEQPVPERRRRPRAEAARMAPPRTSGAGPRAYHEHAPSTDFPICHALHHDVDLRIVRRCPTSRISGTDAGSPSSRSEKALNDEDPHESFPHPRRAHRTGGLRPGPARGACHRGPASELPRRARRVAGGASRVRPVPLRAAPRDADAADPRADRPRGLGALPVRAGHGDAQPDRASGGPPARRGRPRPRVGLPRRA